jgi:hypothetical protein
MPFTIHVSIRSWSYIDGILTRTAKHSNQFAGTTTVVTDRNDIVEHTVVGLGEVCKHIDQMIRSLG